MSELTKEYFDAKFDAVIDRLEKIEDNQTDIYVRMDKLRELVGANDTKIQLINTSLESGNKKFAYLTQDIKAVEDEISVVKKTCGTPVDYDRYRDRVNAMIKGLAIVGTGLLGLAVKAIWDLFTGG